MIFLLEHSGYALSIECDTWEQAEKACEDMGATLQGEWVETIAEDVQ